ncbi:MAG: ArsA-related P-loop ATPase [Myxococcota bacterium]
MSTRVVVCCGVGGTGKTTTAAALGVAHARSGLRTVVLTIDPARRLADALGVELGNEPVRIPGAEGTLAAMMLDRKGTWDSVIRRFADSDAHAEQLLANRYYRAVATRLTGSHEYMAVEKLFELVNSGEWDLVVLDTPPAQHVLDFFRAPDRVRTLLERGVVAALLRPRSGLVGAAARSALGTIQRLAGAEVMAGITEFFELASGLSESLRERSASVADLLASERTRYLLVTDAGAPERSDVLGFVDELRDRGMQFAGFLVNRTAPHPRFDAPLSADLLERPPGFTDAEWAEWSDALLAIPAAATDRATVHRDNARKLVRSAGGAPTWLVPEVPGGIRTIGGLLALGPHLPPNPPAL